MTSMDSQESSSWKCQGVNELAVLSCGWVALLPYGENKVGSVSFGVRAVGCSMSASRVAGLLPGKWPSAALMLVRCESSRYLSALYAS